MSDQVPEGERSNKPKEPKRERVKNTLKSATEGSAKTGAIETSQGTLGLLGQVTGLVAPTLALIAGIALTGNVGRVQRNEPEWFAVAMVLLLAAGAFWIWASIAKGESDGDDASGNTGGSQPSAGSAKKLTAAAVNGGKKLLDFISRPRFLMAFAVLLALVGNAIAIWFTVSSASTQATPRVKATLSKNADHLKVDIKSERLAIDERVVVLIDGIQRAAGGLTIKHGIYQASFGPDEDGEVSETVSTYLPPGLYKSIRIKAYSKEDGFSKKCLTTTTNQQTLLARRGSTLRTIPTAGEGAACLQLPVVSAGTAKVKARVRQKQIYFPSNKKSGKRDNRGSK